MGSHHTVTSGIRAPTLVTSTADAGGEGTQEVVTVTNKAFDIFNSFSCSVHDYDICFSSSIECECI